MPPGAQFCNPGQKRILHTEQYYLPMVGTVGKEISSHQCNKWQHLNYRIISK